MAMVNGANSVNFGPIWLKTTSTTKQIRASAFELRQQSLAGEISAESILKIGPVVENALKNFEFAASIGQNIIDEGREQIGDPVRDIGGEYAIMIVALKGLRDALVSGFPNTLGALAIYKWAGDGKANYVHIMYGTNSVIAIALRTHLTNIVDSIDAPVAA